MDVLERIEHLLCVNTSSVWASGCSNGAQFLFELASDTRIASQIAGIFPAVGLPHNGFNKPPASPMHLVGMWGSKDIIVPPLSNTDDPDKSYDTQSKGWYVDACVLKESVRMYSVHCKVCLTTGHTADLSDVALVRSPCGRYYSTARNTTNQWATELGCTGTRELIAHDSMICSSISGCQDSVVNIECEPGP